MVWGCGASAVKCLVVFFNFLAFISGLAILVAGIVFLVSGQALTSFLKSLQDSKIELPGDITEADIKVALYIAIGLGAVLMLLGFLGCCGACCENQCLLGTFIAIMIIILAVQVGAAIFVLVTKDKYAQNVITDPMKKSFDKAEKEPALCNSWASMQKNLKCCGLDVDRIPPDCTPDGEPKTRLTCTAEEKEKGCDKAISDFLKSSAKIVGIVVLAFALLEFAAIVFSCCLCCAVRRGQELYEYRSAYRR